MKNLEVRQGGNGNWFIYQGQKTKYSKVIVGCHSKAMAETIKDFLLTVDIEEQEKCFAQ
jgi:hypothetical protein